MLRLAQEFALPHEAITQTFGILAKRGMGKTYTALVLAEEFLREGLPVVILDPVGVAWGLRALKDGSPGFPIPILGGDHGDRAISAEDGGAVAAWILRDRRSVVIDLSFLRKKEQTRFVQDFAEKVYHENREPLHIMLDEADAFAPQRPMKGQERMLGAVVDLVRRGRARGIGVTLITQRAAVINKDVLTQIEVLITLRTVSPQDRAAIDAWVKQHARAEERESFLKSLANLPVGTAWLWSPGWLKIFQKVRIRTRTTYDSSRTPAPGEKMPAIQFTEIDLGSFDLPEPMAKDRAGLEAEISRLRGENRRLRETSVAITSEERELFLKLHARLGRVLS